MPICKFFLKGHCKFGNRCRFEHVTPDSQNESRNRNQQRRNNNRYESDDYSEDRNHSNFVKPAHFQHQNFDRNNQGNYSSPFSRNNQQASSSFSTNQQPNFHSNNSFSNQESHQDKFHWKRSSNRFDLLQDHGDGNSFTDSNSEDQALIDTVQKDIATWKGTMWPYSCYSCDKGKQCIEGLADIQAEELRTLFYLHGEDTYKKFMSEVDSMYSRRKQELIDMNNQTKMSVLTNLHCTTEVNPSSCLTILSLYGPNASFKTESNSSLNIPASLQMHNEEQQKPTLPLNLQSSIPTAALSNVSETPKPQPAIATQSLFKTSTMAPDKGSAVTAGTTTNSVYTDKSILTEPELEQFQATSFTLGKIPMRPPPVELCR